MTRIKICGLTRREDIESVNRWLPDYIGFVFCPSRRQVTAEQAGRLKAALDSRIKAVGVFVNAPVGSIVNLCTSRVIDLVQLHGDENEGYVEELKHKIDCPLIKAVRVQSPAQVLQAEQLPCDLLLLDAYQKDQYGGSGKSFDYAMIPALKKPFILAGGLEGSSIIQAIGRGRPYGVDVSSGVETDGVKDDVKIKAIIRNVRNFR